MNTATKLSGFALGLAVVFGATYGVGRVADPVAPPVEAPHDATGGHGNDGEAGHGGDNGTAAHLPGGLLVSDRGYTLHPSAPRPGSSPSRSPARTAGRSPRTTWRTTSACT